MGYFILCGNKAEVEPCLTLVIVVHKICVCLGIVVRSYCLTGIAVLRLDADILYSWYISFPIVA